MPRPKMDPRERAIAKDRLQAASLQQDIAEREHVLEQQSDPTHQRRAMTSMFHPPGRNIYNAHVRVASTIATAVSYETTQDVHASSFRQPASLDAFTEPRPSAIGPVRTPRTTSRRFEPFIPAHRYVRGMTERLQAAYQAIQTTQAHADINPSVSVPPRAEHPEAGSSHMGAQQVREQDVMSDNRRHEVMDQGAVHAPQDVPRFISIPQASVEHPVADGVLHIIHLSAEQAQVVQAAMERNRGSDETVVTLPGPLIPTALEASSTSTAQTKKILDIHAVRTLVCRNLIEAALGRVPKPDGTYDLSDADINRQRVLIAKTGGKWTSEYTFVKPVPTTYDDVVNSWGIAGGTALAELKQTHGEGNSA